MPPERQPPPSLLADDEWEDYEERAAIMEYLGNMTRREAEAAAMADVLGRATL